MAGNLTHISDTHSADNISTITRRFVEQVNPLKVYLFGSYANGSYNKDSDYDFYIVIHDNEDPWEARRKARRAIRYVQDRPVDIVVGTNSRFQKYGKSDDTLFIEGEVYKKGLLLYDKGDAI